jgi:Protein of unknown function (DUF2950)
MNRMSSVMAGRWVSLASTCAVLIATFGCSSAPSEPKQRTFAAPEDAVKTLADTVKKGDVAQVVAIFGPDGQELIDSSDPASAQRSRQVFTAAMRQGWQLVDQGTNRKELVVGDEGWPFPVPLVKDGNLWRFDTAAGKEEVIARRIGRNELAAIEISRTYVAAQRLYAEGAHDGKRKGLYAQTFRSDPGRQNGLYWPAVRGERRSPLGELVTTADARQSASGGTGPSPFHGYFFRILTAQGPSAKGGAKDYVANGDMSGGFALVAWPAEYDVTGVMTFVVSHDGTVSEKDLGAETTALVKAITLYDPDASWKSVQ